MPSKNSENYFAFLIFVVSVKDFATVCNFVLVAMFLCVSYEELFWANADVFDVKEKYLRHRCCCCWLSIGLARRLEATGSGSRNAEMGPLEYSGNDWSE